MTSPRSHREQVAEERFESSLDTLTTKVMLLVPHVLTGVGKHNFEGAGHSLGTAYFPSAFMHKLSVLLELQFQFCICMGL